MHFTPTQMTKFKKTDITSVDKDAEELESSYTNDGILKWYSSFVYFIIFSLKNFLFYIGV